MQGFFDNVPRRVIVSNMKAGLMLNERYIHSVNVFVEMVQIEFPFDAVHVDFMFRAA